MSVASLRKLMKDLNEAAAMADYRRRCPGVNAAADWEQMNNARVANGLKPLRARNRIKIGEMTMLEFVREFNHEQDQQHDI